MRWSTSWAFLLRLLARYCPYLTLPKMSFVPLQLARNCVKQGTITYLHALCFNHDYLPERPTPEQLKVIITDNILRTKGLQSLSILLDFDSALSAAAVISCIRHTRDILRNFDFHAVTSPRVNLLQICDGPKLEELSLAHSSIEGSVAAEFPALKSLSLASPRISSPTLCLLLTACPKLETLSLLAVSVIGDSHEHATVRLSSVSLKYISVEGVNSENFKFDRFILEAPSIETVHLVDYTFKHFELVGKGSLKVLQFKDVSVLNLDISGSTCNLEVVDVSCSVGNPNAYTCTIMWPRLYHVISGSSKLRKLRLWDIVFGDEDDVVNLESMATSFPQLSQLSLRYGLRGGRLHYGMQGLSDLENVTVLEVGWTAINHFFTNWVEGLLQRCPRLMKLVIYGIIPVARNCGDMLVLSDFNSAMIPLTRKYDKVKVEFKYQ